MEQVSNKDLTELNPSHNSDVIKSLEPFQVHRSGDYVLIGDFSSGASIQSEWK